MDDYSEIFLLCDASDYGIGAYLYQLRKSAEHPEGIECPIAFISKSLDERMSKWDTPQKEGVSIFYAFNKLDYLLRDRKFTLKTDHDNLTRLKEDYGTNKKVQRWLLTFQHYDFVVELLFVTQAIYSKLLEFPTCKENQQAQRNSYFLKRIGWDSKTRKQPGNLGGIYETIFL